MHAKAVEIDTVQRVRDERGTRFVLDLDRVPVFRLPNRRRDLIEREEQNANADAGTRPDWRDEADPVGPVIDALLWHRARCVRRAGFGARA